MSNPISGNTPVFDLAGSQIARWISTIPKGDRSPTLFVKVETPGRASRQGVHPLACGC